MTRRRFTFALGCAAAGSLRAQSSQQKGRSLIDRMIQALGGDAFLKMRTRTEFGRAYSFYREELSGLSIARIYTQFIDADEKPGSELRELQRQVFGKKQEAAVIFMPGQAYEVTFRGAKPLSDDRVKQFRETTLHDIFYILRERLQEPGLAFESRGHDVVENQPVEIVDVFDAENRNVTVWLNADTHLPVKQRFYKRDIATRDKLEEVTRYSKYQAAGHGVLWPFDIQRERDTEKIFELYSEKVTVDDNLAPSLFQLRNGIKILRKSTAAA